MLKSQNENCMLWPCLMNTVRSSKCQPQQRAPCMVPRCDADCGSQKDAWPWHGVSGNPNPGPYCPAELSHPALQTSAALPQWPSPPSTAAFSFQYSSFIKFFSLSLTRFITRQNTCTGSRKVYYGLAWGQVTRLRLASACSPY